MDLVDAFLDEKFHEIGNCVNYFVVEQITVMLFVVCSWTNTDFAESGRGRGGGPEENYTLAAIDHRRTCLYLIW